MAELLKIGELLQMAVEDEQTGLTFYNELKKAARSPLVRQAAERFAEQEKVHLKVFSDMVKAAPADTPREDYAGEYMAYVRALLDGKLFPPEGEAAKLAREAKSDRDAIEVALQFERNTLLFFGEIRNFVARKDQETVEKVMDEERQHLVDLAALRHKV
mgnify:CR=1 FL=1